MNIFIEPYARKILLECQPWLQLTFDDYSDLLKFIFRHFFVRALKTYTYQWWIIIVDAKETQF